MANVYATPPSPMMPSSRLAIHSAGQGTLSSAALKSAAPKWMSVGVPNAATARSERGSRVPEITVIATNIKPISPAAAEPMMT